MLPGVGWVAVDLPGLLSAGDICRCLRHANSLHTAWPWHMLGSVFLCKQTQTDKHRRTHVCTHCPNLHACGVKVAKMYRQNQAVTSVPSHTSFSFSIQGVGQSHSSLKCPHLLRAGGWRRMAGALDSAAVLCGFVSCEPALEALALTQGTALRQRCRGGACVAFLFSACVMQSEPLS